MNACLDMMKIGEILDSNPFLDKDMFWERNEFSKFGYLKVNKLISTKVSDAIGEEVKRLSNSFCKRRDVLIESTGHTPRHLSNVPQETIEKQSQIIPRVYRSIYMKGFLESLVGEEVIATPWKWDNYIINRQDRKGDTHGWHWGDYPFTIIWVIDAPVLSDGGLLECVPHTHWDKSKPRVNEILISNERRAYFHRPGDIYLLKADTTLHRVTPLNRDVGRLILNTTWERSRDRDRIVEHETFLFRD